MKKIYCLLPLLLSLLSCIKDPQPDGVLRIKPLTRDYFFFAAPGSWWKMQAAQSPADTFRYSVGMSTIAVWERPNREGKQYEYGFATLEGEVFESDVSASAGDSSDYLKVDFRDFELENRNGIFTGAHVVGLEDSVVVNGKRYDRVLHLHNPTIQHAHSDFWIAPKTGIIKLARLDGATHILVDSKISLQ